MMKETYKWQKLLWSVVIIGIFAFFLQIIYSKSGHEPGAAFVLLLAQPYLLSISFIIILLRLFRFVITRYSFIYILIGTVSLVAGIVEFYLSLISTDYGGFWLYNRFTLLNILAAFFVFLDIFIKEVRGLRKPTIKT